jgi:glucokinase
MLEVNEFLVLDYVRDHGSTTRAEIGRALGLSPASVSRIVRRLGADGMIGEAPSESTPSGRPSSVITFRRDAGAVIGVDLGGTRCQGVLADLSGTVLASTLRPTHGSGDAFGALRASIRAMTREAARRDTPVVALAVGVPGIVDASSATVREAPHVGWNGYPVAERLSSLVSVPFVIENDVNLAAIAHAWRGSGRQVDDFVTLSIGTGIGAAIVSGGRLLSGGHNVAGEVSYLIVRREQIRRRVVGSLGAFEAVASGPGIAAHARELLANGRPSELQGDEVTPERVIMAAEAGDALAREVVDVLLDDLAVALVAFACTVDPELVILDGGLGRSLEPWIEALQERIRPSLPAVPRIVVSELGRDATVLGAVAAALQLARRRAAPPSVQESLAVGGVSGLAG